MKKLKCSSCKKTKPVNEFYENKRNITRGYLSQCKECVKKQNKRRVSKNGLLRTIYYHQRSSSKFRNNPMPNYSFDELKDWVFSQKIYHELYEKWKESGFEKDLIPSLDRKENSISYTLSNLTIMTWEENNRIHYEDMKVGLYGQGKRIIQYNRKMQFLAEYATITIASRLTGIKQAAISSAIKNNSLNLHEYYWKYKKEEN